jgi:nitrite reductase/ring-hydroxylating ferredoxin subunit
LKEKPRGEFPIEWEKDGYVSRREFFKFMTLASGGLAIGSVALAGWSRTRREVRAFEPLRIEGGSELQPGSSLAFEYPRKGDLCLLVRNSNGEFSAFSRRCTHLSCPVQYQAEKNWLYCHCHNGAFSSEDGRVLQGPPPHPLPRILLEVRDGGVWAVGVRLAGGPE